MKNMESEFEKKLKRVKPKGLSKEERNMLWSNITESVSAEAYMQAHKKSQSTVFNVFHGFKRARYFIAAVLAGIFLSGGFATVAFADNSRPGDLLFPVDLAVENIRIWFAPEDERDELRIRFASERLDEVKNLLGFAQSDQEVFGTAVRLSMPAPALQTDEMRMEKAVAEEADVALDTFAIPEEMQESEPAGTMLAADYSNELAEEGALYGEATFLPVVSSAQDERERVDDAFVVAFDYLEGSRDALQARGNDTALMAIDMLIEELTVLADVHAFDIE